MSFRSRLKEPRVLHMIGLAALASAGLLRLFLRAPTRIPENVADFVMGSLYGIAIAALCLSVWRRGRGRPNSGGGATA